MTVPEDTMARYRIVCDTARPGPWKQLNPAFPDLVVTDTPAEREVADCANDEIGLFVATFDPPTVRKLLEYVEANEAYIKVAWTKGENDALKTLEATRRALGLGDA